MVSLHSNKTLRSGGWGLQTWLSGQSACWTSMRGRTQILSVYLKIQLWWCTSGYLGPASLNKTISFWISEETWSQKVRYMSLNVDICSPYKQTHGHMYVCVCIYIYIYTYIYIYISQRHRFVIKKMITMNKCLSLIPSTKCQAYNPRTGEAEMEGLPWVWG